MRETAPGAGTAWERGAGETQGRRAAAGPTRCPWPPDPTWKPSPQRGGQRQGFGGACLDGVMRVGCWSPETLPGLWRLQGAHALPCGDTAGRWPPWAWEESTDTSG